MRRVWAILCAGALALPLIVAPALAQRKTPYWASISAGQANMRTGPGKNYPASWLYRRADLPIKVIEVYKEWRKIEDPDGTQGWMLANLLSDTRTGMVTGSVVEMLEEPRVGAHVQWRAAPGVVGRISKCTRGWCWFDVRGRGGYVEASHLFGIDPAEAMQ